MPIGSTFSIEQMMMALSARSRTTSISNSFQPSTDSSISTSVVGDASSPPATMSAELLAIVGDAAAGAAQSEARADDRRQPDMVERRHGVIQAVGDRRARAFEADLLHRLAELQPVLGLLDRLRRRRSSCPNLSSVPSLKRAKAVLSAVWPPMVGSTASGRSFSMIAATYSGVIGST